MFRRTGIRYYLFGSGLIKTYFLNVILCENNKLCKHTARLLIIAGMLCVLFGNGSHIHTVLDHMSDHGGIHLFVHSHSDVPFQDHHHPGGFDDNTTHHHPTATVDLTGTLTQKTTGTSFDSGIVFYASGASSGHTISETPNPLFLDLPPPDDLYQSRYFSSYSLRGPPLG